MELWTFIRVLLKKWWLILPIFLLTLGATIFFTSQQQPLYQARGTYVVTLNTLLIEDNNFVSALDILSRRTEISTTYAEIAMSRRVRRLAADQLDLSDLSREGLSVDARLIPGTNLLELTVLGRDPVVAMSYVNTIGETTQAYVENLYEVYELTQLDPPIVSSEPVQPNSLINLLLGSVVGLALGVGAAMLAAYLTYEPPTVVDVLASPANHETEASFNGNSLRELRHQMSALQRQVVAQGEVLREVQHLSLETSSAVQETNEAVQTLAKRSTRNPDGAVALQSEKSPLGDHE